MENHVKKSITAFCVAILTVGALASNVLRVLPLGDSITYGQGWDPHGGYRAVLRELLTDAGYAVDYVGTQTSNAGTLRATGDVQHEGHPGWRIAQVTESLAAWAACFNAPHVILLKIGTNDCNSDHDQAMEKTVALLDELRRLQPSAHVIVGTLVTFLDGTAVGRNDAWVREHNDRLRGEVARRAATGERISLADLYPAVSPADGMSDDRHPNEKGYRAMAEVWCKAFREVFPDPAAEREEPALTAVRAIADESGQTVRVDFNAPVSPAAAAAENFTCSELAWLDVRMATGGQGVVLAVQGGLPAGLERTVTVSGVCSVSGRRTVNATGLSVLYQPSGAVHYVPEAKRYRRVYAFDIPMSGFRADVEDPVYRVDDHASVGSFSRIAYYVELRDAKDALSYLWVSMDAFTDDAAKIALPTAKSGAIFQQYVTNLKVWSNVSTVTPGEKARGNIEFWPYNYGGTRVLKIDGASDSACDIDDQCWDNGNFGCMQIHDTAALVPLFCYNNWGGKGGNCNLGIGPNLGGGNIDWTQVGSGQDWPNQRTLEVYVLEAKAPRYPPAPSAVTERVPSAASYAHLYTIDIQPDMNIGLKDGTDYVNTVDVAGYAASHPVDNSALVPKDFTRVGYFLELVDRQGRASWVWTSFDAFSTDFADIDIPTADKAHPMGGHVNGRAVSDLEVCSNVEGIAVGRHLEGGVVEFSPWNYGGGNVRHVPGATEAFDFGDELFLRVNNYGCMQVGNSEARQIVWAVNKFNGRGVGLGIGNSRNADGHIDYTYDSNAGDYASRTLYVLVLPREKTFFNVTVR